jgi:hypothetical protein
MSKTKKGKTPKNIDYFKKSKIIDSVIQYDLNGNFIKEWESVNDVKINFNIKNINLVVNKKRSSAGGFIWRYKSDELLKRDVYLVKNKHEKQRPKSVLQLSLDGEIIKEWKSVCEIKKIHKHINSVLSGKRNTAGGYLWKYKIEFEGL